MRLNITINTYAFPSASGLSDIHAQSWAPVNPGEVRAVLQIAHGMAEHSTRYEAFAKYLCEHGFAVFIHDHLGHGKSIASQEELGYFGETNGWKSLVADCKALTDIAMRLYPDRPYFLFGHSMGSFLARSYCAKYGVQLSGAIFCGTSGSNPAAGMGSTLARSVAKEKGSHYRSDFIDSVAFGNYHKKFHPQRTKFDWLSSDPAVVDAYLADPLCGFLFTAAGYRDLFQLLKNISTRSWYRDVPYVLPMLLISGEMDPVGDYGKGVRQVTRELKHTGHSNVSMELFPGCRHELLNEKNKQAVCDHIMGWLETVLADNVLSKPLKTVVSEGENTP